MKRNETKAKGPEKTLKNRRTEKKLFKPPRIRDFGPVTDKTKGGGGPALDPIGSVFV